MLCGGGEEICIDRCRCEPMERPNANANAERPEPISIILKQQLPGIVPGVERQPLRPRSISEVSIRNHSGYALVNRGHDTRAIQAWGTARSPALRSTRHSRPTVQGFLARLNEDPLRQHGAGRFPPSRQGHPAQGHLCRPEGLGVTGRYYDYARRLARRHRTAAGSSSPLVRRAALVHKVRGALTGPTDTERRRLGGRAIRPRCLRRRGYPARRRPPGPFDGTIHRRRSDIDPWTVPKSRASKPRSCRTLLGPQMPSRVSAQRVSGHCDARQNP
jgi:hypothetical protein